MSSYRAAAYLQIPVDYCRLFGGFRWAQYGEAVEFLEGPATGCTFAFDAEIAQFLEGLQSNRSGVLGFGYVLHLLFMIGLGERATGRGTGAVGTLERISRPFRALGFPLRNAGALGAWLSRRVPDEADPPEFSEICQILTGGSWIPRAVLSQPALRATGPVEEPGLRPAEFSALIGSEVDALSDEEIRHWLRHGRGPSRSSVEQLIPVRPPSLNGLVAELEQRPRLMGLGRLASRLESILYLPPRRLSFAVPQGGGYADVATRGAPEQILPMQFALDGAEFVRRFAAHELLYFHREEPRRPTADELVLVLDQGVRTWGDVRLVLAAAALALLRQAARKRAAIKLGSTSSQGVLFDPALTESRCLSALVEASDFSPNPGRALHDLVSLPATTRRDVVLLTHPRSLAEPEVVAAARTLGSDGMVRLFAVCVEATGQVELAELRHGLPVVLGRSRIDLSGDGEEPVHARASPALAAREPWRGDVEPIGFPFRSAVCDPLVRRFEPVPRWSNNLPFDFDQAGERVVVMGKHGRLFTCRIDGSDAENLPLPIADGEVVSLLGSLVGVAGGFVLVCNRRRRRFLAHYDFSTRSCRVHEPRGDVPVVSWVYFRDSHAIAGLPLKEDQPGVAIDLAVVPSEASTTSRATRAAERALTAVTASRYLVKQPGVDCDERSIDSACRSMRLDPDSGTLHWPSESGTERRLTPLADGAPALAGGRLVRAHHGGDVLAVLVAGATSPGLYFISVSRLTVIGVFTVCDDSFPESFVLSRDGRMFVRLHGRHRVEVREVPGDRPPVMVTRVEHATIPFVSLGDSCLLIHGEQRGQARCLIRWDEGRLMIVREEVDSIFALLGGIATQSSALLPTHLGVRYHPLRFKQKVERGGLIILLDWYNQLAVLRRNGTLVSIFYVSDSEFAGWMPDGTALGSRWLIGGESTPDAAERIALALRSAEQAEGRA